MSRILHTLALSGLSGALALTASAAPLIRDAATFETVTIEDVTLSMTPETAFDTLIAAGYAAATITEYEDWQHGSIEFVRGSYGGPNGLSSVTLGRADEQLVFVTQSLNKPGIDVVAEIGAMQSHFGIASDEVDCRVNRTGTGGSCAVRDAETPDDVTMKFTMTAQSMMILQSVSRPKQLKDTL